MTITSKEHLALAKILESQLAEEKEINQAYKAQLHEAGYINDAERVLFEKAKQDNSKIHQGIQKIEKELVSEVARNVSNLSESDNTLAGLMKILIREVRELKDPKVGKAGEEGDSQPLTQELNSLVKLASDLIRLHFIEDFQKDIGERLAMTSYGGLSYSELNQVADRLVELVESDLRDSILAALQCLSSDEFNHQDWNTEDDLDQY